MKNYGRTIKADVIGVEANLDANADWYSFDGNAGEYVDLRVLGDQLPGSSLDSVLSVFGPDFQHMPYWSSTLFTKGDDHADTFDPLITDLNLPYTGRYYVRVTQYDDLARNRGPYKLVIYKAHISWCGDGIVQPELGETCDSGTLPSHSA